MPIPEQKSVAKPTTKPTVKSNGKSVVDNMDIYENENYIIISVNPKIYSLEIVYSAAYVLMDRAYIILGGDPETKILIELRPKENEKTDLETLGREFNNELLNYAVYMSRAKKTKKLREAIIQRVLMTNVGVPGEESQSPGDSYINDPEGILKPWDEKNVVKKDEGDRDGECQDK